MKKAEEYLKEIPYNKIVRGGRVYINTISELAIIDLINQARKDALDELSSRKSLRSVFTHPYDTVHIQDIEELKDECI